MTTTSGDMDIRMNGVLVCFVGEVSGTFCRVHLSGELRAKLPGIAFDEHGRIALSIDYE